MDEKNVRQRIRDAVMDTFREWGGQWNVTVVAAEDVETEWSIRVHSRPVTRGTLPADVAETYLGDPADPAARARWETVLRPIYERALTPEAD